MRILFAGSIFIASFLSIIVIFWHQEWKFGQPATAPVHLIDISMGDKLEAGVLEKLNADSTSRMFVHFYNYDCPCSRFNIKEFQNLVMKYQKDIRFVAILEATNVEDEKALQQFERKYGLGIPTILDRQASIADALGIYSTPQAVLIDKGRIYYKGNYNAARFCTSKETRFADLALQAMLLGKEAPQLPPIAEMPYGCELPAHGYQLTRLEKIFNF